MFNPASEQMFQYESRDIIGKSIFSLIPQDAHKNNPDLPQYLSQMNTGQSPIKGREMMAKRSDGTSFTIQMSLSEGHIAGKSFCAAFMR